MHTLLAVVDVFFLFSSGGPWLWSYIPYNVYMSMYFPFLFFCCCFCCMCAGKNNGVYNVSRRGGVGGEGLPRDCLARRPLGAKRFILRVEMRCENEAQKRWIVGSCTEDEQFST